MTDLIIRWNPDDLEALRQDIEKEIGRAARLEAVTNAQAGELREPVLIALIVALGGPVITKAITDIIKRHMEHVERMSELANERIAAKHKHDLAMAVIDHEDVEHPITLNELLETSTK